MRRTALALVLAFAFALTGCAGHDGAATKATSQSQTASHEPVAASTAQEDNREDGEMRLVIGETDVDVAWEDNQAVSDLKKLAADGPVTIDLHMYGGFEQVGPLGASLSASDVQMTTTPGDIVLYAGNQISVFYGPNSWSYTKLGHITDKTPDELSSLLGKGDVQMTITVQ